MSVLKTKSGLMMFVEELGKELRRDKRTWKRFLGRRFNILLTGDKAGVGS